MASLEFLPVRLLTGCGDTVPLAIHSHVGCWENEAGECMKKGQNVDLDPGPG